MITLAPVVYRCASVCGTGTTAPAESSCVAAKGNTTVASPASASDEYSASVAAKPSGARKPGRGCIAKADHCCVLAAAICGKSTGAVYEIDCPAELLDVVASVPVSVTVETSVPVTVSVTAVEAV